jgi:hypothetical protein
MLYGPTNKNRLDASDLHFRTLHQHKILIKLFGENPRATEKSTYCPACSYDCLISTEPSSEDFSLFSFIGHTWKRHSRFQTAEYVCIFFTFSPLKRHQFHNLILNHVEFSGRKFEKSSTSSIYLEMFEKKMVRSLNFWWCQKCSRVFMELFGAFVWSTSRRDEPLKVRTPKMSRDHLRRFTVRHAVYAEIDSGSVELAWISVHFPCFLGYSKQKAIICDHWKSYLFIFSQLS